jgi:hypothetical protein
MALSPQLLQFKSSGVYRLEFDKSVTANIDVETLRLVVGHSKKGPYNTPILISNSDEFTDVFGSIDRSLEKKGMFFHRSALEALSRGPILALNLNSFEAGTDLGSFSLPVTNGSVDSLTEANGTKDYSSFFDVDKFMTPSDVAVLSSLAGTDNQLLNFVNIKQSAITVIARQAQDVNEFKITAREWYGEGNVPEYMNDFDYVSDYMIDVFVFKGSFDAATMSTDPVYGAYFTADGLDKTKLDQFAALRQVTLEAKYTGSMLPGFKDLEGRNLYVESMINAESRRTGLFCAIDEDAVMDSKLDLVGHEFDATLDYELLSHVVESGATDRVIATTFPGVDVTPVDGVYAASGSMFTVDYATTANTPATFPISVGQYVPAETADRLAKVKRIAKSGTVYTVYCDVNVPAVWGGEFVKSFEEASDVYKTFVLGGASLAAKKISDVLSVLTGGNGVYDALVDKDAIDFRYVVDTFSSYDANGIHNKRNLAQLAKDRQSAAAILNAPTVADFKASTDPSFKDANGTFKTEFIATGGNLSLNPTKLYTLPSINEGANYAFYYGPGLIVSDNGKDIIVPPAAYVSNNYIDKYTSAQPWSIIAGPRRGVVSGNNVKGVEYSFDKADRDVLEPFGINPIVFQRGAGLTITGNKTAQQSVKSALSSAHVREALIYIQEGIADILKDYVFEFNNTQTRLEIKTLVDSFMESVKQDGGVYEYKNIMDQTNNTDDVIDNNYGIIDTYVEPVKGLEIVVHRTTVLNTGEISTGNFN